MMPGKVQRGRSYHCPKCGNTMEDYEWAKDESKAGFSCLKCGLYVMIEGMSADDREEQVMIEVGAL